MIKSSMKFLDVLFSLNLGTLSYRCPEELSNVAEPGMIVSAPLKNKTVKGIIMGTSSEVPYGEIKDIQKIHGDTPVLSNKMITLLKWMSEYYLTEKGIILKNMLPREAFTKVKQRKTKKVRGGTGESKGERRNYLLNAININDMLLSNLIDSVHKKTYRTFLLQAPSSEYEHSLVVKILSETGDAILLIPEVSQVDAFYSFLHERLGERVSPLHSGMSRGRRSEAIERILTGSSDIVVGTRSAIFAPLKKVSFIAVLHEHSSSYKQKEGLCYSGRDVAVMRGFLEKATVLLSSICPSVESFYNCRIGKYTLIKPEEDIKKPRVRVIDMKQEKLLKPYLSKIVVDSSTRHIQNNKKVMFLINRRGYSPLLQCTDCNYIEECTHCKIPLVFHKMATGDGHSSRILKCHYCGYTTDVPEKCSRCKGYSIKLFGAGTQRVQEDIEGLIGIKTLRLDSDISRKKSEMEELIDAIYREDVRIIIGTKLMTRRLRPESSSGSTRFSMAAILNTDLFMNLPDFRSTEKAYQEISSIVDKIEPQGEIFIQTRMPQNFLFKCLKHHDYNSFFREELIRRKSLHYPPYSRLLLIKFVSKRDIFVELSEIINKTMKIILPHPPLVKVGNDSQRGGKGDYEIKRMDEKVEILGPSRAKNVGGKYVFKLLLKSSLRGALHSVVRTFIEAFKDSKDVKIKVDVDPISM
jgi:primosomal protein N' (replication factor Y)